MSSSNSKASLYERIGGEAAIMAAVGVFYEKVLSDERLKPFFDGVSIDGQSQKMMAFMAWAFGGPQEYKGRDLRIAHAPLVTKGLTDAHFDAIATHLAATLRELNVSDSTSQEVLAIVEKTRIEVLGR